MKFFLKGNKTLSLFISVLILLFFCVQAYGNIVVSKKQWTPEDLPGCVLWLRSDLGVIKDSENRVSQWTDQCKGVNHATQSINGSKPVWYPDQINGYPSIRFDGIDDWLALPNLVMPTREYILFMVLKSTVGGNKVVLGRSYNDYGLDFVVVDQEGKGIYIVRNNPGSAYAYGPTDVYNSFKMVESWYKESGMYIAVNATDLGRGYKVTDILYNAGDSACIGASRTGETTANWFKGDIVEIVLCHTPVVWADLVKVRHYLNPRYQLYLPAKLLLDFTPHVRVNTPMVSFVFDDGYLADYTVAKPVFDAKGEVACSALVSDMVGTSGRLTWDQVSDLVASGWEMLNHGKTHANFTYLSDAELRAEITASQAVFAAHGLTVNHVVYPGGASNVAVRETITEYFKMGIQIDNDGWLNYGYFKPGLAQVNRRLAHDYTQLDAHKAAVDTIQVLNGWLIFYNFNIDGNLATMIGELIDYIQSKSIPIVTISGGYSNLIQEF